MYSCKNIFPTRHVAMLANLITIVVIGVIAASVASAASPVQPETMVIPAIRARLPVVRSAKVEKRKDKSKGESLVAAHLKAMRKSILKAQSVATISTFHRSGYISSLMVSSISDQITAATPRRTHSQNNKREISSRLVMQSGLIVRSSASMISALIR